MYSTLFLAKWDYLFLKNEGTNTIRNSVIKMGLDSSNNNNVAKQIKGSLIFIF